MTLSTKPLSLPTEVTFTSPEDLNLAVKNNSPLEERVVSIQNTYYTINITKAMEQLAQVGKLTQLAHAGGQGLPCAKNIVAILAKHHRSIKDLSLAFTSFVAGCLSALQAHRGALQVGEKKIETALEFMSDSVQQAGEMAKMAGDLVSKVDEDKRISIEQMVEVLKELHEIKTRETGLQSKLKELGSQIGEAKEAEAKAAAAVAPPPVVAEIVAQGGQENPNSGAPAGSGPILPRAVDIPASFSAKAIQMEREANAAIAESIVKLQSVSVKNNDLEKTIASLELTIKVLAIKKNVFENVHLYWKEVDKHCTALTNVSQIKMLADPDLIEQFIRAINQSAFSWLALGRINLIASDAIKSVDKGVDHIMNNLPTKDEAATLISTLSAELLEQINQENAVLAASTS